MKLKLLAIFVTVFMSASLIKAQTIIPYLPQQEDFSGSAIADPAEFKYTIKDFTLEADGTQGIEITIGGSVAAYTPESTGKVRFVQKSEIIYVFEGGAYKTSITPAIPENQNPNLISNGGFETNNGSGNGKTAENWTAYTAAQTANTNAGNPRSNQKYSGSYSFFGRSDGSNILAYLVQAVSGLKANTQYEISYYYRANEANQAGAQYKAALGSSEFGTESAELTAHTVSGTAWTQFKDVITTNEVVPAYFCLHRTNAGAGNYYDYFDDIVLREVPAITGITGAANPVYLEGSAAAPQVVFNNLQMEMPLVNPDFEANQSDNQWTIPGWTKAGSGNQYCTRNNDGPSGFKHGNVYFQNWDGSGSTADFDLSQQLTSVPNGEYTLIAKAGGDAGTLSGTFLYAGTKEVEVTATGEHTLNGIVVVDNTVSVGFKSIQRNHNWAYADHFRLYYNGPVTEKQAFLHGLKIKDIPAAGILPETKAYTYEIAPGKLPADTDIIATVSEGATYSVNAAGETAVITVTNDTEENTYTITFTYSSNYMYGWDALQADGVTPERAGWSASDNSLSWGVKQSGSDRANAYYRTDAASSFAFYADSRNGSEIITYAYPVVLEAGNYLFTGKNWRRNGQNAADASNVTFAVSSSQTADGTIAGQTIRCAQAAYDDYSFGFTIETAGTYYFIRYGENAAGGFHQDGSKDLVLQKAHKVTFETDGGTAVDPQFIAADGTALKPADPEKEDYIFVDWYTDASLTTVYDFSSPVTAGITVYAKWKKDPATKLYAAEENGLNIYAVPGGIKISSETAGSISIYSAAGQLIKQTDVETGETFLSLPSGLYIANNQKVIVK